MRPLTPDSLLHLVRRCALIVACALPISISISAQSAPLPIANDALLHSARMWEARSRDDLAMLALQKLVAARPDSPEALQALGELALRTGDINAATQILTQLKQRFANHKVTQTFAFEYRLATSDRLQLASLQRLILLNRLNEAKAEMLRLFPDGAPDGYLALDYFSMLARLPDSWQRVYVGLSSLAQRHSDDPRFQLALAKHLLRNDARADEGLRMLVALARRDDIRVSTVDDALIVALKEKPLSLVPVAALRSYTARNPQDREAANLLARVRHHERRIAQWQQDVVSLIAPDSNTTDAAALLAQWRTTNKPMDRAVAALQILELESTTPKDTNASQAIQAWRLRGRNELQQRRYDDAELSLGIALALQQQRYEDTIALAETLESRGHEMDSGALLATAQSLAPRSSWLFETRVRWMIQHAQSNNRLAHAALDLLHQRATDKNYTESTRRELLSNALQARAAYLHEPQPRSAQSRSAIEDLRNALALTPDDVWLRYRLSNWLAEQGDSEQASHLMSAGVNLAPDSAQMRYAQALYLSSMNEDDKALAALQSFPAAQFTPDMHDLQARLLQAQQRRTLYTQIDSLVNQQQFAQAATLLDELIAAQPDNRGLRSWRAELDIKMNRHDAARDRFAALVAEQPDDVSARLDYVRALAANGETGLARLQLHAAQQRAGRDDAGLQLDIAKRLWSLDDSAGTSATLLPVLPQLPNQADAWLLAGRSEQAQRHFAVARDYYLHAEKLATPDISDEAGALRQALDERRQSTFSSALLNRHKPGDAGVSQFDSQVWANSFDWAIDYDQHLILRADATSLSAGTWNPNDAATTLLGTHYLYAGQLNAPVNTSSVNTSPVNANQASSQQSSNETRDQTQRGVALGAMYANDTWQADLGTTPLGFELVNVVGGVAWRPTIKDISLTIGAERRAITSSLLSHAGMVDPDTGQHWGGVTATGPWVAAGHYAERFSVSASLRAAALSGTGVQHNQMWQARTAADWRWYNTDHDRAWVGLSLSHWQYRHNLQNATFGSGGYYSPQSWTSVTMPIEWQGLRGALSYQLRFATTFSRTRTDASDYFPNDATLQQQARDLAASQFDGEPIFSGGRGSGFSVSASARVEYEVLRSWVVGSEFSIDRADYYHPVDVSLYLRHRFGGSSALRSPPEPLRPYNE